MRDRDSYISSFPQFLNIYIGRYIFALGFKECLNTTKTSGTRVTEKVVGQQLHTPNTLNPIRWLLTCSTFATVKPIVRGMHPYYRPQLLHQIGLKRRWAGLYTAALP